MNNDSGSTTSPEIQSPTNNEISLKERELAIKEKELAIKEQEVKAKILIDKRNFWISSPLILGLFGIFTAGIGAALQGYSNFQLERQKFEFSLIQKALEEEDKKEAAKQLLFLINSDVIKSLNVEKITKIAEDPEQLPTITDTASLFWGNEDETNSSISLTFENPSNATITGTPGVKNIRSGPGTVYNIIQKVNTGSQVKVLSSANDRGGYQWYQIYHSDSNTSGWIVAHLVKIDGD